MNFLTRTSVLWTLFVVFLATGAAFGFLSDAVGGKYLDTISEPVLARELLAKLTPEQAEAHFWVTVLLDTVYPLAYGGLLMGLALRFFGEYRVAAAMPAALTAIVDLTENMVQALALSGAADVLDSKEWLTTLKFGLLLVAVAIALVALGIALYRRLVRKAG